MNLHPPALSLTPHGKTVVRDLGAVLHIPGVMALVSIPVCLGFGERFAITPLLITVALSIVPGQAMYRGCRDAPHMGLRHAMVMVVLAWVLVPLIGAVPIYGISLAAAGGGAGALPFESFLDAFFEATSGFTSTGLTMAERPSELPHILQWWRSLMQWVGGVGVIVLMLSIFHPEADSYRLYFSEGREQTVLPDVADSARIIWWIYGLFTAASILLLFLAGMSGWQAVNYGMTGIATGGFGITDGSLGDFDTGPRLIMILVMIAGAISFAIHYRIIARRHVRALWHEPECRLLYLLLIVGAGLLGLENLWQGEAPVWLDSLFQWTSALTTSGFGTVDLAAWSITAHLLLCLGMACGGVAGATTGGLKLKRVLRLWHGAYARVHGIALHPWRLMEHRPMAERPPRSWRRCGCWPCWWAPWC
jgi:trk system potassium uptake protein TrkH